MGDANTTLDPWAKNCSCEHHVGPHWIYQDFLVRQMLRERLAETGDLRGYAIEEKNRIAEKRGRMLALGISEIPQAVVEQAERDWSNASLVSARRRKAHATALLESAERALVELAAEHDIAEGTARVAIAEKIADLHKRAAEHRAQVASADEALARGPRKVMSADELSQKALVRMGPDDRAALVGSER